MLQTLRMSKEGSGGLRCCSDGVWRAWEGVGDEKGYREGRRAPDLLLELTYCTAPSQNLTKSGLWTTPNQLHVPSFLKRRTQLNMAFPWKDVKWVWIRTRPNLTLFPDLCLLLQDLDNCQTTRTWCIIGIQ